MAVQITGSQIQNNTIAAGKIDLTGSFDFSNGTLIVSSNPTQGGQAVSKSYVDNVAAGISWKAPVKAASTGNLTLSGEQTVDGVALVAGDRVLVKAQTTATENGIYIVSVSSWSRSSDMDQDAEFPGAAVFVEGGNTNAQAGFTCTNNAVSVGVTSITFVQFNGAAAILAGDGLSKTGNELSVNTDGTTLEISSDALRIKDSGVDTDKLADLSVTTGKIANNAVTNAKLQNSTISGKSLGSNLDSLSVLSGSALTMSAYNGSGAVSDLAVQVDGVSMEIATNAVQIKDLGVSTAKIADLGVTTAKINDSAVTSVKIANMAVTTAKIDDSNVTTVKLADAAVTTLKIADANVTTDKIADANVTTAKIADSAVTTAKILDANVSTAKIADSAVTSLKIAADAVTTAKILDANVSTAKIADSAVTTQKLSDGSVTSSKIVDGSVVSVKLSDGSVTSSKIVDGSVVAVKIATSAVTTDKIDALAVTTGKLADAAVTTLKIADANVTTAKIADANVTNAKLAGNITADKLNLGQGLLNQSGSLQAKVDGSNIFLNPSQQIDINFQSRWKTLAPNGSLVDFDLDVTLKGKFSQILVFKNGLALEQVISPATSDEYSISQNGGAGGVGRISFGAAPGSNDNLRVFYIA